ncbi:GIY-YIG nuclease family protein [Marinilabiliaceae bacterium JC017]|nr:GIY-YIG nuclease family protein [Marinilabiliaceae bacterium JC017]
MAIYLNDLLRLDKLENVKIRFNQSTSNANPIDVFKNDRYSLLNWQFHNYSKNRSFYEGQIAIGFVRIEGDKWLLFDISLITRDLNKFNTVGYEFETLTDYEKYFGRVIIEFKNKAQNMIRKAESVIHECKVIQILEDTFDNDVFPGYENVNLSWHDLNRVINKGVWKSTLENQKGIYLITDTNSGKMYVGSAYGNNMIHGRWSDYIRTGHGGNEELKKLEFSYIQNHFRYSILDIYKSTIDDNVIIDRESWWKKTLMTRDFGYNKN